MTSTNDGKDVKSSQISVQKAKTFYIELYKTLEARLSVESELGARTSLLCEAWRRVHCLCQHSAASTHPHLISWLQRHTAQTLLQSEWRQTSINQDKHDALGAAIDFFILECQEAAITRDGGARPQWEAQLLQRARWFHTVLADPWGNAVLRALLDRDADPPTDQQIVEWLKEERGVFFVARLRQLASSRKTVDIALSLASAVMERARACAPPVCDAEPPPDEPEDNDKPLTFTDILSKEAGFTVDVWELITDIEFVLLYNERSKCIALAKQTPLNLGYQQVERLHSRIDISSREKRLWKNATDVAILIAQVMIARCMVVPVCTGTARATLYGCARSLARLLPAARLPGAAAALAAPAATARHLHTLALAIDAQCKNERKPFVCELYIRAITAGMNELERLKLTKEKESEARLAEKLLSSWFTSLGSLLGASARLAYECALTAFSLHPSPAMYERIREAPQLQPVPANKEVQEPESETNSEFGSWATDSRSQTNLVKTSETLNLKKIQKHSNVLSTAVLNEGEGLGLSPELCQDLIVLLSGPRVKTLSWDMDKEVLVENCRSYMERTHGGTRALTTELKYLNLGPDSFMHLPEEEEDENDIYYGIEKGYEHLVELQDPEEIWQTGPSDPERTESCYSTEVETFIPIPKQKKKLKEKLYSDSSDEEELDPLGEYLPVITKPKQRTQSNERKYKVRKKKEGEGRHRNSSKVKKDSEKAIISELIEGTSTPDVNKPQQKPKKERKKRVKKEKDKKDPPVKKSIETGLSRLVGKKVMLNPKNTQELLLNCDITADLSNQLCITDSDYDSQGKSSIASAHTEANDPEVLFDGLFSMDEQKSLEKTSEPLISSIDKPNASHSGENIQKNRSLIKLLQKPTKTNSLYPNKKNIESSKKLPKTQFAYPILNRNIYDISNASRSSNLPHENAKVKQSIKRLLEFRRQKSASDLLKATKHISNPQQNINVINKIDNNLKILPVIPKAISVPDIPKLYINKQQSQQLSLLTNEVNNILQKGTVEKCQPYQSTPNIPTGQPNFPLNNLSMDTNLVESRKSVHEHLNKVELNNPRNTTGHVTGTPNLSKDSISNFKQSNTEINVSNTEQGELHDFFKELHRSINAGVRNDYSPVSVLKPHTEVPTSSLINYSKQIKHHRIVENAPNTFSRLQYMHKNKQGENLEKQMCQATQNNLQVLSQQQTIEQQNVIESILARFNCIRKVEKKPQGKVNSANELSSSSLSISNAHQSVIRKAIGPDDRNVLKPNFMPSKNIIIQSTNISTPRITKVHEKGDNIGPDDGLVLKSNYIPSKHTQSTNVATPTTTKVQEKDNNIGPDDRLVMKSNYMTMKHAIIHSTNISTPKTTKVHEKDDKLRILLRQQNSTSKPRIISDSVINKGTLNRLSQNVDYKRIKDCQLKIRCNKNLPVQQSVAEIQPRSTSILKTTSTKNNITTTQHKSIETTNESMQHMRSEDRNETKCEQDWESVLNDLLSHKTPIRGPNALDMVLKKDQRNLFNDVRENRVGQKNSTTVSVTEKLKKSAHDEGIIKETVHVIPQQSKTFMSTENITALEAQSSKNFLTHSKNNTCLKIKPHILKPKEQNSTKKSNQNVMRKQVSKIPEANISLGPLKKDCSVPQASIDPISSDLFFSDYDILEELMDDDLRQEIGELSSDEENLRDKNSFPNKQSGRRKSDIGKPVSLLGPPSFDSTDNLNLRQNDCPSNKQVNIISQNNIDEIFPSVKPCCENTNLIINKPIHNTMFIPNNTKFQSRIQQARKPNIIQQTSKLNTTLTSVQSHELDQFKKENEIKSAHQTPAFTPNSLYTATTVHMPITHTNVNCTNQNYLQPNVQVKEISQEMFTAEKQQPSIQNMLLSQERAVQNVLLIRPEIVYQPYTIQIPDRVNSTICNLNSDNFVTVDALPTISMYGAPVINPVIISNTVTVPMTEMDSKLNIYSSIKNSYNNSFDNETARSAKNLRVPESSVSKIIEENPLNTADASSHFLNIHRSNADLLNQNNEKAGTANEFVSNNSCTRRMLADEKEPLTVTTSSNTVRAAYKSIFKKSVASSGSELNNITPNEFKNLPVDLKSHEINQKPCMGSDNLKIDIVGNEFKSDNSSRIVLSKIHKKCIEISSSCATSAAKNKESENTNNVNESLSENMIEPSKVSPLKVTRSTHSPKHTMTAVDDLKTDNKVKNCIANNTFERKVPSEGYDNCNAGTLCCTENAVTKMYKQSNTEPAECVPDVTQKVLNNTTYSETKEQSINLANVVNPTTNTEIKGYNRPTKNKTERKVLCEVQEKLHLYSENIISKTSPISEDGFKKENQTTRDERIKEKKLAILNRQVHIFNNSKPIPLTYDCLKSVILVAQKTKPTEVKVSVTQPVKVKNDFSQRETLASTDTVDKISNANDNKSLHTDVLKENNESDPTKCLRSSKKLVIGDTLVLAKSKNNEGKAVETQIKIKVPGVNKRKVCKRIKKKTKRKVQRNKSSSRKTKSDNNQNPLKKVDSFIEKLRPPSIDIEDQLQGALILKTISQKANDIGIEDQPRGSIIPEKISQISNDIVKTTGNQNVRKNKSIKGNITTEKDIHCHPTNQGNISKNKVSMSYKGLKIANCLQPTLKDVNHRDIRNENNLVKKGKTLHSNKQNIITGEDIHHQPTNQQNISKNKGSMSHKGLKIAGFSSLSMGLNKINKPVIEAQTTNGDKLSTNTANPQNKTKIKSIQNGQIMELSHTNIYMKSQKNNAVDQNVIDSYRDQIKFTELPRQENDDPLKRCVSIKLANGNSFKATISGKAPIDLKSLFDDPELRKVLLNFLPSKSRCVLSIPQFGSSRGVNLKTQVIGPKKNLETINLVSDDEEDPASREFQTEFGKFYVRGLTDVIFNEHQKIFSKKCSVKLNRSQVSSKKCSSTDDNMEIIDDVSSTTCTRIMSSDDMDPQLRGVNNNQIIEIDDSSNDSTDVMNSGTRPLEVSEGLKNDLRELQETLLKDLYVDLNTKPIVADKLQLHSQKKVDVNIKELKETLLKDLCGLGGADQNTEKIKSDGQVLTKCDVMEKKTVEAHSTECQSKNDNKLNNIVILPSKDLSVDSMIPNIQCIEGTKHANGRKPLFVTSQDELIPIKECQLKIKKCDDLVKNYQLLKQKLCYVYLERCDKFISSETTMAQKEINMSETTTVSELEELKFNRKTQSTDLDEFDSLVIRRSKSFSILNELDICDESPIDQLAMGPIEYSMSEDEKTAKSYYERVGKMNDDFNNCRSEWCMTKFEFHYLAKLIQHDNYLSDDVSTDYESDHNDYESVVSESLSNEIKTPNILPQVPSLLRLTIEVSSRSISYSDYNTQQTLATNTNSSHHLKRKHDASENILSNEKIIKLDRIGCQVQDLNNIQKTVLQEVPTNSCPESRNLTNHLDMYDDLAITNLNITSIKSDNCLTTRNEEIVSCYDSYKKSDVELKQTDSPARKINEIKIKKICRQESISNVAVLDCINENREVSSIGNPVESLRFESDYDKETIQSFGSNIECAIQGTENNTRCIEQDTLPYDQIVQQRNIRASDQFVVYDSLNKNLDSRNDNLDKISCSNIKALDIKDLGLIEGDQEENSRMVKPDTNEAISIDIQNNMLSCQSVGIYKTNKMECDKNVVLSLANLCTTYVIKLFEGINCDKSKKYVSEKTILDNRNECFEDSCNYTSNTNIIEYLTSNKFTAAPKTDISRNTTETYNMQRNSPVRTEIVLGNTYELRDTVDVNCTLMAINDVKKSDSSEETPLNDNLNDLDQSSTWVKNIKCNMENSSFVNTIDKEESNNVNNNCNIDQSIIMVNNDCSKETSHNDNLHNNAKNDNSMLSTSRVNSEMCNMAESLRVTTTDMEKESHNEIADVEQSSIRINVENNDNKDTSSKDRFNEYFINDFEQSSSWVKNEMCDMEHSKYVNSSDIEKDSSGCCDQRTLIAPWSTGSDKNEENEENSEKPIGNNILNQNIEVDNFEQSSSFVNSEICNMVQSSLVDIADKEVESSNINCDMEESGPSSNGNKCKNNGNTIITKDNFNKNLKPDNMEQSSNWVSNEMCDVLSNYVNTTNMEEDPSDIIYNTVQSISGDRGDKTNIEFDESFTATSKAVYLSNVNLYKESKLHYPEDTKLSQSNFTKSNFDMVKVSENISNVENTDNSIDLLLKTDSLKQSESPVYNMEPFTCGSSDHLEILDENRKIEVFTAMDVNAQSCEKYEVKNDTKINELPFMNDMTPDNNYNDSSLVLEAQPETTEPEQQDRRSSKITTDIEENSSLNCTENTTQIKSLKDSTIIMDSNDDKYNTNINNDLTGEQMLLVKDSQENVIVEFPPCPKNITLLCENSIILKGSIIENPIVGTCYVFPIINSDTNNIDNEDIIPDLGTDLCDDFDLTVTKPKVTYSKINHYVGINYKEKVSRRGLKRKIESVDNKLQQKKYRKGKNIDYPKITVAAMCDFGYSKQFKNLSIYCNSIKFSYTKHYHLMQVDEVDTMLKNWPIDNSTLPAVESNISNVGNVEQKTSTEARQSATDVSSDNYKLFVDNFETKSLPDPLRLTLAEELSASYDEEKYFSSEINETNFKMGFGEGSGRVNQNLIKEMESSKFSAVTLSDVKQYQPFLQSVDTNKSCYRDTSTSQNQLRMLKKCYSYIKLRDKVKNFFNKTTAEFNYLSMIGKFQLEKIKSDSDNLLNNMADFPFGLVVPEFFEPPLMESIVQVVQVGQLPVSAGAQNPVTCDPRVTQVTDASPPQYSVESVSHDGLQPNIKTEYTELTTADISLPIMSNFEHQNQEPISASQGSSAPICNDNVTIETEVKIEVLDEGSENTDDQSHDTKDFSTFSGDRIIGSQYSYDDTGMKVAIKNEPDVKIVFEPAEDNIDHNEIAEAQHQQNGSSEKPDQLAHAMNAAGITTSPDTAIDLSNTLPRSVHYEKENNYNRTNITAMTLQQALTQVLPLNQKTDAEINPPVASQILHIVNGKSTSLTQIALDNNPQQSVINTPNTTPVLHIVQSKSGSTSSIANDSPVHNSNSYSGLSLVDAGLSQRGNQLLHIVNTGNQKSNNTTQLLKRVNLLTNLTNVQGSTEQKMVQFVCKSTDAKGIQLNTHQRSMVLRLHPIESPQSIKSDSHASNPTNTDSPSKKPVIRQELKSRSVYEENYAKFIQNSTKQPVLDKSTSLPKFNQAFGKPVFQEDNQKRNEIEADSSHLSTEGNIENNECQSNDHSLNLESARQVDTSPPLLFRKQSSQVSQAQQNLVQQIKQAITPMNLQTMHGGVIYTRQIPVNIGGGQTINLITVPSTERIDDSQKQKTDLKFGGKGEVEQAIIKIVPQSPARVNSENSVDDSNSSGVSTENAQNSQPPPMLTQMRIKLPMLSKNPQMVSTARVVRPSFFQIHRNVLTGSNQPVYQQLVLATTPTLGQQAIRLPHAQTSREIKMGADSQSSPESQMSSSTLEQLREFDMVLEQVKERSTVQPNGTPEHDFPKAHTNSTETTDTTPTSSTPAATTQQVLYSIGNNQPLNIAYVHRKSTVVATAATTSFARSPDTSGIVESPTSSSLLPSTHAPHTVTSETTNESQPPQREHKSSKVSSKSKSRPKSHHSPFKINPVPPKPSNQKPIEDEQTTQRILYILAEYKEQVENSPDKDKPAPRRRTNLQAAAAAAAIASASGSTKRKKSSSGSRRSGRDSSPLDDNCRTMGSEDSSCGTSQGDCSESCLELNSPQSSPRKVAKKLSFEQDSPVKQLRLPMLQPQVHSQQQQSQPRGQSLPLPQLPRNVLVTDGPTIAVTRAAPGKPATAVLMPANYILPVSMVKNGQQIAIVTNRGPKILTVQGAGEGVPTNALLLQRLIGPGGLKPILARPGIRQVRLPTAALHNLQTFNLTAATSVQQPVASPASATSPPDLIDTKAPRSPWTAPETEEAKPADSSPEQPEKEVDPEPEPELEPEPDPDPEPWNVPQDYSYEETVRTEMDRTVLDAIPDRYSPDMEAQRIFDKMFDVESKKGYIIDSQDDSPRCPYDIDTSDCDDKAFHQVVQRRDGNRRFVSAATLRQKFALMEDELRLQKSLSEECEDLGVDSPSASDLFPEAELLFSSSPAHESHHQPHTPLPVIPSQPSSTSKPEIEEISPAEERRGGGVGGGGGGGDGGGGGLGFGLEDVGVVTVSEDGLRATIALDHEEFVRSHPNTTFHTEPSDDGEVQPVTLADLKARHITSSIFQAGRAPATVLVAAPHTVISQATPDGAGVDRHLSTLPKDDTYPRYDSILNANATQVIRRVRYDHRRDYLDDSDRLIDDGGDATLESLDDRSSPERHPELFWDRTSRSRLDFSSDSDKCCKSPYDENNSTDSSVANVRLDSVIKDARIDRMGSDAIDDVPPLRTYPPKRTARDRERSVTGKSKEERFPETLEGRRRASNRGVVKRGCHCCSGSPAPQKPKKPRQRKPTLDFN